ncbi:MAG: O-antigen ligase family protein [Candidatus Omnitrophica bacterium]|nr:O-antigen ligase family protein [Candidatus Omnitrophota bacterium]
MHDPGLTVLACLVLASSVLLLTLINTNAGIVLLIVSMLLSPEIGLGAVQPDRAVVIRFDDLLLGVVFFTWLAKLAMNKELGLIRNTPLNLPIGLFLVSCLVSTGWGLLNGSVAKPLASAFYLLKYFEYFLLFFMVANVTRDRRQVGLFLSSLLAVAVVVSLYGYWQVVSQGPGFRVTAPFEGKHGEPNTLAGYLVLMMAVCAGLALHAASVPKRLLFVGLAAFMLVPFVYTYSRGGYVAFVATYLTLCLLSKRHKPLLLTLLLVGVLAAPLVLPESVFRRIASTFTSTGAVQIGRVHLEPSAGQRILIWKLIIEQWKKHPFLGFGVTGVGLVDNQNALILGELGLVGMAIYLWSRWRIFHVSLQVYRTVDDPLGKGLGLGFLAGFIGLLVHSFAGNIFIIVRIMEPFWLVAALITVLPGVSAPADPAPSAAQRAVRIPRPVASS